MHDMQGLVRDDNSGESGHYLRVYQWNSLIKLADPMVPQHAMLYNPEAALGHLSCASQNSGFQEGYPVALLV